MARCGSKCWAELRRVGRSSRQGTGYWSSVRHPARALPLPVRGVLPYRQAQRQGWADSGERGSCASGGGEERVALPPTGEGCLGPLSPIPGLCTLLPESGEGSGGGAGEEAFAVLGRGRPVAVVGRLEVRFGLGAPKRWVTASHGGASEACMEEQVTRFQGECRMRFRRRTPGLARSVPLPHGLFFRDH